MDAKHVMKYHASQNIPLNYEEAYELGMYVLEGMRGDILAQIQSVALLSALHNEATYKWQGDRSRGFSHGHRLPDTSAEQIAGICAAIFEHDIAKSEFGFLEPGVPYVMDNCGMGGDLVVTANISTIAAFIAASAGVPMCKHGSPANADQGRHGSSDFISSICGIDTFAPKSEIEACVSKYNFGYTEALDARYKHIHLQTHTFAHLPHMNDIIGPMTNPVHPKKMTRRVLGVNHLVPPFVVAQAYQILNAKCITNLEHGMIVRGYVNGNHHDGIDEVSICAGGTDVAELKDGKIRTYRVFAKDFGIEPIPLEAVSPIGNKGEYSLKILRGEIDGQRLDIVLANAAILFYLAGRAESLADCFQMASSIFKSGRPMETMLSVRKSLAWEKAPV